jgi:hypothetical protein
MSLSFEQEGDAGGVVRDDGRVVAEIRELRLTKGIFRPGGESFLGPEVPLPLYWMQYANHEDPERNAGSHASLHVVPADGDEILIRCKGATASGAARSETTLRIGMTAAPVRYHYGITSRLEVVSPEGWMVTRNPSHGDVEFANLGPRESFTTGGGKRYDACYLVGRRGVSRIPHHHLESADKHRIAMGPGDRFLWGLEEENLCLTIDSGGRVTAGVCAYMWDAHFAFDVTEGKASVVLPGGALLHAAYTLSSLDRKAAEALIVGATDRPAPERGPLYVEGVNRFSDTIDTPGIDVQNAWPWETEGAGEFTVDRACGYDDVHSLRIRHSETATGVWKATALGPAYGKPGWRGGAQFRFSARVRSKDFTGVAAVGIRLHREGREGLFDTERYERYISETLGGEAWTHLEVITPPIVPPPDRLHLLLVGRGKGSVWFDNAHLEVL